VEATPDAFERLVRELDIWRGAGTTASIWLRDDDASAPSPALDRLLALAAGHRCPTLVAVIPALAIGPLAERLTTETLAVPCVHGFRHANHAPPSLKRTELIENSPTRTPAHVVEELREGLGMLKAMFGLALAPILVPPWNRMSDAVAGRVHEAGFAAISGHGWRRFASDLPQMNTHVDIIDWSGSRGGHGPTVVADMAVRSLHCARASGATAVGILTHHLTHDETAWKVLERLLATLADHPACRFADARELLLAAPR
jgi:hypothetical protein